MAQPCRATCYSEADSQALEGVLLPFPQLIVRKLGEQGRIAAMLAHLAARHSADVKGFDT